MTAGHGTRLRPFTGVMSKPLLPILSIPTIHLVCDHLSAHGVTKSICNLHAHPDETREGIESYAGQMEFRFSDERNEILGSWGGVVTAGKQISSERFFWINGDVITSSDLTQLSKTHAALKAKHPKLEMTLLLARSGKSKAEYREIKVDQKTGLVTEAGKLGTDVLFYASSAVIEKKCLVPFQSNQPLDFVKDYLTDAIKRGVVGFSEQKKEIWLDIGSPELWAQAHFEIIRAIETHALPSYWMERLTEINEKISPGVWRLSELEVPSEIKYKSPVYLGAGDYDWDADKSLGPDLVLYGLEESETELSSRIVYSGMSVQFSKK